MTSPFTTTRAASPTDPPEPAAIDAEFEDVTSDVTFNTVIALRQRLGLLEELEVASALGLQTRTLKSWRTERTGPAYVKAGKSVFYLFEDVRDWLRAVRVVHETKTTSTQMGEGNDDAEKGLPEEHGRGAGQADQGGEAGGPSD